MHIVYVTTEFVTDYNFYGGLANFTANMATIFAKNNHKVTILVAGINYNNKVFEWKKNVTVEYINFQDNIFINLLTEYLDIHQDDKRMTKLLYIIRGYIIKGSINRINKEHKVDLVHYCNLLAVGLIKSSRIPNVVRMSSYPGLARNVSGTQFKMEDALKNLNQLELIELEVIKKTRHVISPSQITAQLIKQTISKNIAVIESPFFMGNVEWDYHIYDNHLSNKKYLLFYGSLCLVKGIHIIDQIIYNYLDKNKDCYFVMVGHDDGITSEGNGRMLAHKKIEKSAKEYADRVLYFNAMPKKRLFPIIDNAYACVLPSIIDNLPNTCIESMGLKKLVIGTNGSSIEQLIVDGRSGLLCEVGSPESLLAAIERAMNMDINAINQIGENAKERISRLSPERVYEKYFRYYNKSISCNKFNRWGKKHGI